MTGSGYAAGVRVEHAVIHALTADGYDCTRAAGSKGSRDVIAFKPGQVLLINVKKSANGLPSPAERARLLTVAAWLAPLAVPLVALGPASCLTYRRLTGPGPDQWVPWSADFLAGVNPMTTNWGADALADYVEVLSKHHLLPGTFNCTCSTPACVEVYSLRHLAFQLVEADVRRDASPGAAS